MAKKKEEKHHKMKAKHGHNAEHMMEEKMKMHKHKKKK